ncbi:MAG: hypothetical protein M3O22_00215 [Pseudomonadota bacterium]|nr:hypothetical protein [Pseudomonadota bacterium]
MPMLALGSHTHLLPEKILWLKIDAVLAGGLQNKLLLTRRDESTCFPALNRCRVPVAKETGCRRRAAKPSDDVICLRHTHRIRLLRKTVNMECVLIS